MDLKEEGGLNTAVSKNKVNRDDLVDGIFFAILFLVALSATFRLFYLQATSEGSLYPSDMNAYILEIQGLNDTYSFPYPILFWLGRIFKRMVTPKCAMALATASLNGLGMILMKWLLNDCMKAEVTEWMKKAKMENWTWVVGIGISILSIALFFISMILLPGNLWLPGMRHKCIGVFSSNPFHNATYMAARPFAILSFFSFVRILERYEKDRNYPEKKEWKEFVFFSVSLLLTTMAKPSFTIVLVGTAGLHMLFILFSSRFQKLRSTILLGLYFIPTFLALLYQYSGVFVSKEEAVEAGIGFCMGDVWHLYCSFIPSAIMLGAGFPVIVLIFHFRELKKDVRFRFSWQLYVMSLLMAYFLYEKGFRKNDFNFAWGYMYGIFFAFVGSVTVLYLTTAKLLCKKGDGEEKNLLFGKKHPFWVIAFEWAFFLLHVISGLIYFGWLSKGASYF